MRNRLRRLDMKNCVSVRYIHSQNLKLVNKTISHLFVRSTDPKGNRNSDDTRNWEEVYCVYRPVLGNGSFFFLSKQDYLRQNVGLHYVISYVNKLVFLSFSIVFLGVIGLRLWTYLFNKMGLSVGPLVSFLFLVRPEWTSQVRKRIHCQILFNFSDPVPSRSYVVSLQYLFNLRLFYFANPTNPPFYFWSVHQIVSLRMKWYFTTSYLLVSITGFFFLEIYVTFL